MLGQYLPVVVLAILAVVFAVGGLATSRLLAPRKPTVAKLSPYECGIVPGREAPERFPVRFFLVAMIFIVFDIEIIFLYPWAIIYRDLGPVGLWDVVIFAGAVVVSFAYLLSHGALDWGPAKARPEEPGMVSEERTAATTVRRVGLEGRSRPGAPGEAA